MTEPIPGPAGLPFIGNAKEVDLTNSGPDLSRLADTYGKYAVSTMVHPLMVAQVQSSNSDWVVPIGFSSTT